MTYISRDPFAREELHREIVRLDSSDTRTCDYCGNVTRHRLFQYYVETDSGRRFDISGLFCSRECMKAFHN